jgi:hypothetical protein
MAAAGKNVGVGQLAHLSGGRFHKTFLVVAKADAPKAGQGVEIILSPVIIDENAFAAFQYERAGLPVAREIGIWVDEGFNVSGL